MNALMLGLLFLTGMDNNDYQTRVASQALLTSMGNNAVLALVLSENQGFEVRRACEVVRIDIFPPVETWEDMEEIPVYPGGFPLPTWFVNR